MKWPPFIQLHHNEVYSLMEEKSYHNRPPRFITKQSPSIWHFRLSLQWNITFNLIRLLYAGANHERYFTLQKYFLFCSNSWGFLSNSLNIGCCTNSLYIHIAITVQSFNISFSAKLSDGEKRPPSENAFVCVENIHLKVNLLFLSDVG